MIQWPGYWANDEGNAWWNGNVSNDIDDRWNDTKWLKWRSDDDHEGKWYYYYWWYSIILWLCDDGWFEGILKWLTWLHSHLMMLRPLHYLHASLTMSTLIIHLIGNSIDSIWLIYDTLMMIIGIDICSTNGDDCAGDIIPHSLQWLLVMTDRWKEREAMTIDLSRLSRLTLMMMTDVVRCIPFHWPDPSRWWAQLSHWSDSLIQTDDTIDWNDIEMMTLMAMMTMTNIETEWWRPRLMKAVTNDNEVAWQPENQPMTKMKAMWQWAWKVIVMTNDSKMINKWHRWPMTDINRWQYGRMK